MGIRRQSRELALQFLFQNEFQHEQSREESLRLFQTTTHALPEVWNYMESLVKGVEESRSDVDKHLTSASAQWKLDRMSHIDRNVMRIAVYEMLFSPDLIPPSIAINEAVEISRRFGGSDSASFVNGVLDQISKMARVSS